MAVPNSRTTLKDYALRQLGAPVTQINVADEQLEDRIDEALQLFVEYNADATEPIFWTHQITQAEIDQEYISVPEEVHTITYLYPLTQYHANTIFSVEYQLHMNDIFSLRKNGGLLDYVIAQQSLAQFQDILSREKSFSFIRHMNRLKVSTNWATTFSADSYIVADAYRIVDPDTHTSVYNDIWLKQYVVELFRRQWGQNLSKFGGVNLPGGIVLDGVAMVEKADSEIERLKEELELKYADPALFFMG